MPNYAADQNGKKTRFRAQGKPSLPLAKKPRNVKHYQVVEDALVGMEAPAAYVREAVLLKLREDGLIAEEIASTKT